MTGKSQKPSEAPKAISTEMAEWEKKLQYLQDAIPPENFEEIRRQIEPVLDDFGPKDDPFEK